MSTQLDLSSASGVGPFDITALDLIPNNRIDWNSQLDVKQNGATIAGTQYTIDVNLGTITFVSDISGLSTLIVRDTPSELAVQFIDGARIPAADLNDAFKQVSNEVDELRTDPVSGLQLNDLSDVGAPGDTPAADDILLYDGSDWVFENRGSINAVTAQNVSTAFNSSNGELTMQSHDARLDGLEDKTVHTTVTGNTTDFAFDVDIAGDLVVDGSITFGSLASSLNISGTVNADQFFASTSNGLTGFKLQNSGNGTQTTWSMDMASTSGYVAERTTTDAGFQWYTNSSQLAMQLDGDHQLRLVKDGDTNDFVQIKPEEIGTTGWAIAVREGGSAQGGIDGQGKVYGQSNETGTYERLRGNADNDARYNRNPPNDSQKWGPTNVPFDTSTSPNTYFASAPYLPVSEPRPNLGNRGDANNGVYHASSVGEFSGDLNGSEQCFVWQYTVWFKSSSTLQYITRTGSGTGDHLFGLIQDDRDSRSAGISEGSAESPQDLGNNTYCVSLIYNAIDNG